VHAIPDEDIIFPAIHVLHVEMHAPVTTSPSVDTDDPITTLDTIDTDEPEIRALATLTLVPAIISPPTPSLPVILVRSLKIVDPHTEILLPPMRPFPTDKVPYTRS